MAYHSLDLGSPIFKFTRIHGAALLCIASLGNALAQNPTPEITITSPSPQQVSGFGDVPLSKAPFSAISIDNATLRDIGATRISDALRLDASVTDSYNSPAYWDMLSVRGYTLDNRYNYRREGLPISAETMIPMENKERIELLKGTSGIQAGTSSPGGLANYVVKRAPTGNDDTIRAVTASYGNGKSSSIALDLGGRFGETKEFGYRFNTAYEDLNPYIRNTQGHRHLVALAMDWRVSADSKLELEFEQSERQQMGVNGYSLLANPNDPLAKPSLPTTVDGTRNFTRQTWSVPGFFGATTGSLRWKQNLGEGWLWTTSYGAQRLRTDDRLTFGLGHNCYGTDPSTAALCDRFSADGRFDVYDYRSDNEQRKVDALKTEISGSLTWGSIKHDLIASVLRYRLLDRLPPLQAYNLVGEGNTKNSFATSPDGALTYPNVNRSEYNTEVSISDRLELIRGTTIWVGIRHTQFNRQSSENASCDENYVCTPAPGTNPVFSNGHINTPWLALSQQITPLSQAYASYGEGVELNVTPNNPKYTNAGQTLPVLRSQQYEIGLKNQTTAGRWQAALFDIARPQTGDAGGCDGVNNCTRQIDGQAHHRGLELSGGIALGQWNADLSTTWIEAKRQNAQIDAINTNGQSALNVPKVVVRALAQYRWLQVPGLRTSLRLNHEGERRVLEDGTLNLPAWTTLDFAAHYDTRMQGTRTEWTVGIDNLTDQHYWRESPKQFGHYYLYPGAPRTARISLRTSF